MVGRTTVDRVLAGSIPVSGTEEVKTMDLPPEVEVVLIMGATITVGGALVLVLLEPLTEFVRCCSELILNF